MTNPQIVYVDAYDSFSNNIIDLLRTSIDADVHCVKIDDFELFDHKDETSLGNYLSHFHAVVVGPGPGHPTQKKDIGWIDQIWNLSDSHLLPIFGICLGFQSLCNAFGGEVRGYAMLKGFLLMCIGSSANRTTSWAGPSGRAQWRKRVRRTRALQWDHVSLAAR